MRITRRIMLAAVPLLAVVPLALAAVPAEAAGPFNIWLENGSQAVGANSISAGSQVINVGHPGRSMTFVQQGTDGNGNPYGYWEFSNGNFMASNNACNGVTVKSDPSSNGVVWVEYFTGGHLYYPNRYCSGGANLYAWKLESDNQNGDQWSIASFATCTAGCYFKITLNSS